VAVAGSTGGLIIALDRMPPITRTGKHRIQLRLQHRLNEVAHPLAQAGFDRVEPIVEKIGGSLSPTMIDIGIQSSYGHGVVSCPTLQRRMIRG